MLEEIKIPPFQCTGKRGVCQGEAERAALLTSQTAGPRLHITLFPHNESQKPQLSTPAHTEPPRGSVGRLAPSPCPDPADRCRPFLPVRSASSSQLSPKPTQTFSVPHKPRSDIRKQSLRAQSPTSDSQVGFFFPLTPNLEFRSTQKAAL